MKKIALLLILALAALSSCMPAVGSQSAAPSPLLAAIPGQTPIIEFRIVDNGLSSNSTEVIIDNMHPGATAEAIYRIYNDTTGNITPVIFPLFNLDPSDYDRASGYSLIHAKAKSWVNIPDMSSINPGCYEDFLISLSIPDGEKDIPEKWTYQVAAAGGNGGLTQYAWSIWWLVSMR